MIQILNPAEINKIRASAKVTSELLVALKQATQPGVCGVDLDQIVANLMAQAQVQPNFLGYHGFPARLCCSVNTALIHGIPDHQPFRDGDLVGIDVGCIYQGWHSDAAFSTIVGQPQNAESVQLLKTTRQALLAAVAMVQPGIRVGKISATIQNLVEKAGFYLPTAYAGHGIGQAMHQEPMVPNVGSPAQGVRLQPGMVLCIEPMVQTSSAQTRVAADGWTVCNATGGLAAHYEAMVLVTKTGHELLTTIIE